MVRYGRELFEEGDVYHVGTACIVRWDDSEDHVGVGPVEPGVLVWTGFYCVLLKR